MNLCSDGHTEICYEERYCPLCKLIQETEEKAKGLNEEIKRLEDKLDEAGDKIYDLTEKLEKK